jgi:hypothetical protein
MARERNVAASSHRLAFRPRTMTAVILSVAKDLCSIVEQPHRKPL